MKKNFNYFFIVFCMFLIQPIYGQNQTVTGNVSDEEGNPTIGAIVRVQGESTGAVTDTEGNFSIEASPGDILIIDYVGMNPQEITLGDSTALTVILQEDTLMDDIVVVAYGTSTQGSFTGSASTIQSEDLENRTVTNPLSAIEGNATGVQFISPSGQPGSAPAIRIRGVGTLNGDANPLYIVDGLQFEGSISSINQSDIESITVLKDAASTALYGSRAANGVVIITTKNGKQGGPIKVNFNTQYGVSNRGVDLYEAADPGLYYELLWEAYKNSLGGAGFEEEASATIYNRLGYNPFNVANDNIVGVDGNLNPDARVISDGLNWFDALEQDGARLNSSLSVSGGGENHDIYLSTSYLEEEGYVVESIYDRITTRLKANFDVKDWLTIGGNGNMAFSEQAGPSFGLSSIVNPFGFAKNMGSIYPVYVVDNEGNTVVGADGQPLWDLGEGYPEYGIQPRPNNPGRHALAENVLNDDRNRTNNFGYRTYAQINILDGLSAKIEFGQDINDYINKSYENEIVGDGAPGGRYGETRFRRTTENFNQIINYGNSLNELHNFDVTLGHESFDRNYSQNNALTNTQTASGIYEFANFPSISNLYGYSSDYNLEGFFGRLNYDYDNKYHLSLSGRRDGTSVFNSDVRWGNFYSVGAAWLLSEEDFIRDVDQIDYLKLRGSFGEVGNDDLNDYYISQARYSLYSNAGVPGIFWSDLGNNALTWETIGTWDVALEFALFNNFLEGSAEYYRKNSSDLLYNVPISPSNGLNEKPENIGDMYNEGFEFGLTGNLIEKADFNWDLTLQASTLNNEITSLPSPFIDGSKRWEEGRSRYDFFVYHYAGVDPENGDALYYMFEENVETETFDPVLNVDGSHATTNDWSDAGRAYANVSSVPDLLGSVSNRLNYKGFGLDFLFVYGLGGKVLDYGYANMMNEGIYGESIHQDMQNAWRAPGDDTNIPRLEVGNVDLVQNLSTRFLTDADYLALRNVNFSYNIGTELSNKIGVDNMRLYFTGENLLLNSKRTGLNPQYNLAGTPAGNDFNFAKTASLGLNVTF